jgi:hypothetical protein
MTSNPQESLRVLAIDPFSGGFGFVIFEGSQRLIDWGVKTARQDTNTRCIKLIANLTGRYEPDVIVIESLVGGMRRSRRAKALIRRVGTSAAQRNIDVRAVFHPRLKEVFAESGAITKQQIALTIAKQFPELYYSLPSPRKIGACEDSRMSIFDAAALALFFYQSAQT